MYLLIASIALIGVSYSSFAQYLGTGILPAAACGLKGTVTYNWNADPNDQTATKVGLSVYNKSGKTAFISVDNKSMGKQDLISGFTRWLTNETPVYQVADGSILNIELDIAQPTTVTFYDCTDLDTCDPFSKAKLGSFKFTKGKTIYINWPTDGKVYPQRGPMFGLTRRTNMCYSLSNNVAQSDIKPVK